MIEARTKTEKRAIAKTLAGHDPVTLEDYKMLGKIFGPMELVGYELTDSDAQNRLVSDYERNLCQAKGEERERAQRALQAARQATSD